MHTEGSQVSNFIKYTSEFWSSKKVSFIKKKKKENHNSALATVQNAEWEPNACRWADISRETGHLFEFSLFFHDCGELFFLKVCSAEVQFKLQGESSLISNITSPFHCNLHHRFNQYQAILCFPEYSPFFQLSVQYLHGLCTTMKPVLRSLNI